MIFFDRQVHLTISTWNQPIGFVKILDVESRDLFLKSRDAN